MISCRIELLDSQNGERTLSHPSASTTASNITHSSAQGGDSAMGSSSKSADRSQFGEEIEMYSLLIIDQHTFEGELVLPLAKLYLCKMVEIFVVNLCQIFSSLTEIDMSFLGTRMLLQYGKV